MTSTEWAIYGLASVWESSVVSTSTGSPPPVVTAARRLISPTGFRIDETVVRY